MISTTSIVRAEVLKPEKLPNTYDGMLEDRLKVEDWLLIEIATLRALRQDQAGCEESYSKLGEHNQNLLEELSSFEDKIYALETENYELRNPRWWESVAFWSVVSGATGFILGGLILASATGGI